MTAPEPDHPKAPRAMWAWIALMVITAGAFVQAGSLAWTGWDDTAYITKNPHMTAPDGLARIWTTNESEQYYPLTFSLYWAEYRAFGGNATGYHIVGVLLHLANVLLLHRLLRSLWGLSFGAFVGAALFAVHPTQVITIAWIAEQKNTLAVLFMLLTMLAWVRSGRSERPGAGRAWYLLSLSCFALGLLAKTAILGLPFALLALDHFVLRRSWKHGLARAVPMLILAGLLAALTLLFEQKFVDKTARDWMPALAERLQIAGAAPWAYLGRLLWPVDLSVAYSPWAINRASVLWWLPAASTAVCIAAAVVLWRRRRLPAAWAWAGAHFLFLLGPTLGVIAFGNLAVTPTSDHFLYPASLALFAALGLSLDRLRDARPGLAFPLTLGAWVGIIACGIMTLLEVPVWKNTVTLWTRAVRVAPGNYTAHLGLAEGLFEAGKPAQAMPHYEAAIRLRPNWVDAYLFLASAQRDTGDLTAAEATYRKALILAPDNTQVACDLAAMLERRRALPEALALYEATVQRTPGEVEPRIGLGRMYLGYARYADAAGQFRSAADAHPTDPRGHLGLVTAAQGQGLERDALAACDQGLRQVPGDPALLNMSARLRLTARDQALRDPSLALKHALAAATAAGSQPGGYLILETLALAQAVSGDLRRAAETATLGADLARAAGDTPAESGLRAAAEDYRSGRVR